MQSKQTVDCKFRHAVSLATAAFMGMGGALAPAAVSADEAEDFYIREVDSMVQGNCVVCHRSGGQADAGGADILFTSSASANHQAFIDYISVPGGAPDRGRADRVLSKITGGSGHGGGVIFSNGSSQYQTFSAYMDLLLAPDEPVAERRVALEEPVEGEIHTGVGNLRGWAVATDGIERIEILVDGVPKFDAPYGGSRRDVGGAFPDIEGSSTSGFSLAYNYSNLSVGPHTITAIAHSKEGGTVESSASFNVVRFEGEFIRDEGAVKLDGGVCTLASDEITITDAIVDGNLYNLMLKWRTAEQGFEIVEIR